MGSHVVLRPTLLRVVVLINIISRSSSLRHRWQDFVFLFDEEVSGQWRAISLHLCGCRRLSSLRCRSQGMMQASGIPGDQTEPM